ncbi:cytochrome P450 [Elsinoe ampelina]|uniref:Cytochrome P450 n=1 Tax=Elsinoe ampelina TaxID=302913 RepID=A0A6A6FZT5_9PEZI|nr:cytochrome P450 [Elsinoe ampelina]
MVPTTLHLIPFWKTFLMVLLLPKPIPGIPYRSAAVRNIFGDIPDLLDGTSRSGKTYMQWIQEQMRELQTPIMQVFIRPFSKPVIILGDFRESQDILMRSKDWDRSDMLGEVMNGLLPDHHLGQPTNATWKAHRNLLHNLMSPGFLNNVAAPGVHRAVSVLISLWILKAKLAAGKPFSAQDDIYTTALDGVNAFAFGSEFEYNATRPKLEVLQSIAQDSVDPMLDAAASENVEEAMDFPEAELPEVIRATLDLTAAVEEVQGSPVVWLKWILVKLRPHLRKALTIKDKYIRKELSQALEHMKREETCDQERNAEGDPRVRSAIDHMVQREKDLATKENREPQFFSSKMMVETFGFVIGGHDTTSTTVLWGLKKLADNQESQSLLRSALQRCYTRARSENRGPSVDEITTTNIPYLDAVIEEILRHSGTTPALDRQAVVDTTVLGYPIPKGTLLLMLTGGPSLRSPGFEIDEARRSESCQGAKRQGKTRNEWDNRDIDSFRPERWLVPLGDGKVGLHQDGEFDSGAGPMLAFGLGIRGCFGRRLGYLELKIIFALIVWNFELLPCPKDLSGYSCKMGVTTKPKDTYVRLKRVILA